MKPDPWRLRQLVPSETLALAADHLARTSGRAVPDWALVSQGRSVHAATEQRSQHAEPVERRELLSLVARARPYVIGTS